MGYRIFSVESNHKLTDLEVLDSIKLAASGATYFFSGIEKFNCDPEKETKELIEHELMIELVKKHGEEYGWIWPPNIEELI